MRRDWPSLLLIVLLPLADLWWNLAHLNIGLVDFYGLSAFAHAFVCNGAWPATPYFPAGYPLLLIPFGYLGSTLVGGYLLSASGIMLALYAAWMLARQMEAGRLASASVVVLCWLTPVCRVVSGSPSVDALYTGLGLWFIASAIAAWRIHGAGSVAGQGGLSRWVRLGLLLPALILPLLRYHAIVLLAPVLLVLALARRGTRTALISLLALVLAVVFNYSTNYIAYHKTLPSVAGIQVLTGLELRYHKLYNSGSESLWNDYPRFCERARQTSILSIFAPKEVASSWLKNWEMFLRQPSVLMLCVLLAGAGIFRRPLPRGSALGLSWVAAYTLVLAVTYYTARSAALPVMLATTLGLATVQNIATARNKLRLLGLVVILLVCGFLAASGFAVKDLSERTQWAAKSRWLDHVAQEPRASQQINLSEIAVSDWRFLPLHHNAWTSPYVTTSLGWIDDPEIHPSQRASIHTIAFADLASQHPPVRYVVALREQDTIAGYERDALAAISRLSQWSEYLRTKNADATYTFIYIFNDDAIPVSGAVPTAP